MRVITRKKLIQLGATSYQAKLVTKNLKVVRKEGRSNLYSASEVLSGCAALLNNKRVKKTTRDAISELFEKIDEIYDYLKKEEITQAQANESIKELLIEAAKYQSTPTVVSLDTWRKARA